jgi:hypothetical protein
LRPFFNTASFSVLVLLVSSGEEDSMNRSARRSVVALAASIFSVSLVVPIGADQAKPATVTSTTGTAVRARYFPPVKGVAEVGYFVKQKSKKVGGDIVTVFTVKNLSETHSIVLLRIEETWYNRKSEPVGGKTERYKKPLMPGEVTDIEIRTPYDPGFYANTHTFMHAHGKCATKKVATLDALMKES